MNPVQREHRFESGQKLQLVQGDLTRERVGAIVNAANAHLRHGGGVAGAILRAGGPQIQQESAAWVRAHGPVPHDRPAFTGAGNLPCRYVIHAVGPVWGSGDEETKLSAAVHGSLACADRLDLTSIALPAISTGIFGFPKARAARVIYAAIQSYYSRKPQSNLRLARLTIIDRPTLDAFIRAWDLFFNPSGADA